MFIRKVHIALAAVVLVAQMMAFSAPAFAAEKTTGQQPLPQNQDQPQHNDKTLKDTTPINEGVVVDPAHNSVADPSTNASSDASKTQGIVSTHCAPGFELVNNRCTPKDDESGTSSSKEEDPILIHCGPGTDCSKEGSDAPKNDNDKSGSSDSNEDDSVQQPATTPSVSGVVPGCPFDFVYNEGTDECLPDPDELEFGGVLFDGKPLPDSFGGLVIGFTGHIPGDALTLLGAEFQVGFGDIIGNALSNWGDELGGPLGWGLQGIGAGVSFEGDLVGTVLEGAGYAVSNVSEGVGEVVDDVGSAAGDAWDEVSSWF